VGFFSAATGWRDLATIALGALAIIPLAGLTALYSNVLVARTRPPANVRSGWKSSLAAIIDVLGAILDNVSFIAPILEALSHG
jgi:hypothetical protein